MARFVRIQSTKPIVVTGGLQSINMTAYESQNPEKLNVKASWPAFRVAIKAGAGYYPSVVKNWPTVQSLSEAQILTVGEETDIVPEDYRKEAEEVADRIEYELSKYVKQKKLETVDPNTKKARAKKVKEEDEETLFSSEE